MELQVLDYLWFLDSNKNNEILNEKKGIVTLTDCFSVSYYKIAIQHQSSLAELSFNKYGRHDRQNSSKITSAAVIAFVFFILNCSFEEETMYKRELKKTFNISARKLLLRIGLTEYISIYI